MVARSGAIGLALSLGLVFPAAPGASVPDRLVVSFTPEAALIEVEPARVLTWINTPSSECGTLCEIP